MNTQPSELQTKRGRFFFWIGLLILPIFWVGWMRPAYFSHTQRRAGWVWTACYVAVLIAGRQFVGERLEAVLFSYNAVAVQLGAALWLWWLFRAFTVVEAFTVYIITGEVLIGYSRWVSMAWKWMDASPAIFIFPLVPAVLHLLLEPFRRWKRSFRAKAVQ